MSDLWYSFKQTLVEEAGQIRDRLAYIERTLEDLDKHENRELKAGHESVVVKSKPTAVIRRLFTDHPNQKWHPMDVRHEIGTMIEKGLVDTKEGKNPRDFVYRVLKNLAKEGFVEMHQPFPKSRHSYYIKTK